MKLTTTVLALLLPISAGAGQCPWKVAELEGEIASAVERVEDAWADTRRKDKEIASLRRLAIVDCQESGAEQKLSAFVVAAPGFDISAAVQQAELLSVCIDEKHAEGQSRLADARATRNRTLERRLLTVIADIDGYRPRVLDHQISANQLASKIGRLVEEREDLLTTCSAGAF